MTTLGFATQLILIVTVVCCAINWAWGWLSDRHLKRYHASEKRIDILWTQGTLRKKER